MAILGSGGGIKTDRNGRGGGGRFGGTSTTSTPTTAVNPNRAGRGGSGSFATKAVIPSVSQYVAAPAQQPAQAPTQRQAIPSSGGGIGTTYGGGSLSATGTGTIAEASPQKSYQEYAADPSLAMQDSGYQTAAAASDAEYQNMIDQLSRQNANYLTDFKGGFKNLGLNWQGDDYQNAAWNPEDKLGAYGQAYGNLQNDYAGRGMLDSTFYGNAQNDMTGRFNQQKADLLSGLQSQNTEFAGQKTAAASSQAAAKNQAMAEAYARYLSGYGA